MAAFKFNNATALLVTGCTLVALTLFASFIVTALAVGTVTFIADKFFMGGKP